jgi:nucleoside-diphosphate-sugar epimerase
MSSPNTETPQSVDELEAALSVPTTGVIRTLESVSGHLMLLGVGGKMGPTLARMAKQAYREAGRDGRVIGVSRFSDHAVRRRLESWGVETIACDLLDEAAVNQLPEVENVIAMTGFKFGAAANPSLTWAMNCYLPAMISRRFSASRIAVFSSGNVYGLTPVAGGGSRVDDPLRPVGEYAMTVLGRERMYEYFSRELGIRMVLLRLNYATELRYGVLVDIALRVLQGEPIDVTMGYVNVIWQREANAMALEALACTEVPPRVLNIAGPEILKVRDVANEFGRLFGKSVELVGQEAEDAFLNNAEASFQQFGRPQVSAAQVIRWTAEWVLRGGENWGKPTHFEGRDGTY